ncbi:MAG TPA: YggS family pyridoxal phosphate-dependent enzyme [Myxococcales bacterium]|nr:YggS family pyridoxal phosphate-dependent enzyme [Myxococcales bacterium]
MNQGIQVSQVAENLSAVRERIARAALRVGRDSKSVKLVAVSKVQPLEALRAALAAGQRALGENYAQELRDKAEALSAHDPRPEWHFLGALQTNKVKQVVGRAELVHTCDRPALAQELSKRAVAQGIVQRVLVEVNVGREPQKAGVLPEAAGAFLRALAQLPGLSCEGLMCIPPAEGDPRSHFRALRTLRDQLLRERVHPGPLAELSMGMSSDYEVAVEEGATLVRVGTAIFGARPARPGAPAP